MRTILIFSIAYFFNNALFCQKTKLIAIHVIDSLEAMKYSFYTNNGKETIRISNNFKANKIELKFKYFSIYPYLNIQYGQGGSDNYSTQLIFNNQKHSIVNIPIAFNEAQAFESYNFGQISNIQNDSILQGIFKLFKNEISEEMNFMNKHGDTIFKSDSLRHVFKSLVLAVHEKQLGYIINHSKCYNMFWYFKNSVLSNLVLCRSSDVNDYVYLLNYFKKYFPTTFRNSMEGKIFKNQITTRINAINNAKKVKIQFPASVKEKASP